MMMLVAAALLAPLGGAPLAADTRVVLCLGDSLTSGYGLSLAEAFPAQLEAALRADGIAVRVINAGVAGDTTAGGLARLDWVLADAPDLVIVELGANDALRGFAPNLTEDNLDAILSRLGATGVPVVLAGMLAPPNLGPEYGRAFSGLYPRLAVKHGATLYPFFLAGVAAEPRLNQADGMHPNASGVARIVAGIGPMIARLLGGGS